jgi:hypothetical protein
MAHQRIIDMTGDPLLQVLFLWSGNDLAAWVLAQHDVDLWVIQELREDDRGEWQLEGPVKWHHWDGTPCTDVPARVRRRTGLDQQLRRIGPAVERYRAFVGELPSQSPAAEVGQELLDRLDAIKFRARTRRGQTPESSEQHTFVGSAHQAEQRRRRREGLVKPQVSEDELAFYRLTHL